MARLLSHRRQETAESRVPRRFLRGHLAHHHEHAGAFRASQAVFYNDAQFPARYRGALFVAFQGSWNREPPTGYKVVAVTFANGKPTGIMDFVTGWLTDSYRVYGHPIGVAVAADGSLYVCDDTGNLFRVSHSG